MSNKGGQVWWKAKKFVCDEKPRSSDMMKREGFSVQKSHELKL